MAVVDVCGSFSCPQKYAAADEDSEGSHEWTMSGGVSNGRLEQLLRLVPPQSRLLGAPKCGQLSNTSTLRNNTNGEQDESAPMFSWCTLL